MKITITHCYKWASIFLVVAVLGVAANVRGATNISSQNAEHWGWSDAIGWVDFYTSNTVTVTAAKIEGYANSSVGEIAFDCATASVPNCAVQYGVKNAGNGNLAGFAWNDNIGWISFCGGRGPDPDCPGSVVYQVQINPTTGVFGGPVSYAWNDVIGWISFNCADYGGCTAINNYNVTTSWRTVQASGSLESVTFDTGVNLGAQLNSILWRGAMPGGTSVNFQIAASNCENGATDAGACVQNVGWGGAKISGDGAFIGPSGNSSSYYGIGLGPNTSIIVDNRFHNNKQYYRYKVILYTDATQAFTPRIDDIVLNWSP